MTGSLTTGTDAKVGGTGADTLSGVLQAAGADGTTVAPGDSFDGGAGVDTVNIAVAGALGGDYTLSAFSTTAVEKVLLSNFETSVNNNIVDASLMSGLTTVGLSSSAATGDTEFTGLKNLVGAEMRNGAADLTLTYNTDVVAGTADAQTLTVSNLSAGTFTAAGVETVNIVTETVASTLTAVTAANATTLNISGDKNLTITTANATKTIDASAMTGNLSIKSGVASQKITGGAGNDTIDMVGTITATDTINGGAGTADTLKFTLGADTIDATAVTGELIGVTNIEVIDVAATADTAVLDLSGFSGVTTVTAAANVKTYQVTAFANSTAIVFTLNGVEYTTAATDGTADAAEAATLISGVIDALAGFTATNGGTDTVTITSVTGEAIEIGQPTGGATAATVSAYSDVTFSNLAAGVAVDVYSADKVTASLKDASGTADALTVNLKTVSADKGFAHTVGEISTGNIETINLTANGMTDGKITTVTTLTATNTKTLNITGDSDVTIGTLTAAAMTAIDGSTSTGDLSLTLSATKDQSIKTGTGNDTIAMVGTLTAADTIDGGANTVLADGTAGKDTLTATGNVGTTSTAAALNISNVETIEVAVGGAATTNINAAGIVGATNLAFSASSGTVTVTGLAATTKIGVGTGTDEMVGTLDLSLADATGTADAITLDFSDTLNDDATVVVKVASTVETLNISATKDTGAQDQTMTLTNTNMAAKNIVVTDGDAGSTLALGTLNAATTNVDASAYKGILTVTGATDVAMTVKANGAVANNIATSSGADTITLSGNLGTAVNVIAGGTGNDILNATANNAATDFTSVSAIETINLTIAASTAVGFDDAGKDDGLNAATYINLLGGDTLSTFTVSTAVIDDAEKVIDATGFNGAVALTLAVNALDADMTIKGGALTTDTVTTSVNAAAVEVLKSMTGIETLVVNSVDNGDAASGVDLTNVTGLNTLDVRFLTTTNADEITVNKLASGVAVKVTSTKTADNLVIDLASKADLDNTLNLEITATDTTSDVLNLDAAGVETLNITNKETNIVVVKLDGVNATATTGKVTVNVLGTGPTTLTSMDSDINVVNASTATGALTIAAADRTTSAMTITGGEGADSIAMTNTADVLAAGLGADTLNVTALQILGGLSIDLSATGDQVTTFNGSANAAVQSGFLHVNLSGITGTFGSDITANSAGSTITGTSNTDLITGGAGADVITGGVGADVMTGGATAANTFAFAAGDTATPSATNFDTITDFTAVAANAIDWTGGNVTVNSSAVVAASGKAGLAGAGVKATFHGDDTTLALHIAAIEAALVDTTHTAGEAAHWQEGADTYVFITDGVGGVGAGDMLIKLVGVDLTVAGNDVATIVANNFTLA